MFNFLAFQSVTNFQTYYHPVQTKQQKSHESLCQQLTIKTTYFSNCFISKVPAFQTVRLTFL